MMRFLHPATARRPSRQQGLSLVELMVALLVSSILMAGAVRVFVGSKHSYEVQNDLAYIQENSRFAIEALSHDLLMAGHWGGVTGGDVDVLASVAPAFTALGACDDAWFEDVEEAVRGFDGAATSPLAGCIQDADYVPNTDILVVRYGDAGDMVADADLDSASSPNNADRFFVRSQIGRRGVLFKGSDRGNAIGAIPAGDDAYNYTYQVAVYFLRPCSRKAGATCAATDDGGDPMPTLTRLVVRNGSLVQEPVVEGVEQLQLLYGVSTDADPDVEEFRAAAAMAAGDWDDVVSVKVDLVARAEDLDLNHTAPATLSLADGTVTYTLPAGTSHYRRQVINRAVQLRNRSRS